MAVDGTWNITIETPMGAQTGTLTLKQDGDALTGEMAAPAGTVPVANGKVDGDTLTWDVDVTSPMPLTLSFEGKVEGGDIGGSVKLGSFGNSTFSGTAA